MLPFSSRFTQCRLVIENVLIKGITNFGEFFENNSKEPHPKYFIGKLNFIKSKPGVKIVQIRSFFWSVFFHIRTEYCISPYSVQMRENTDQKNSVFGYFSRSGGKAKKGTWLVLVEQNNSKIVINLRWIIQTNTWNKSFLRITGIHVL